MIYSHSQHISWLCFTFAFHVPTIRFINASHNHHRSSVLMICVVLFSFSGSSAVAEDFVCLMAVSSLKLAPSTAMNIAL